MNERSNLSLFVVVIFLAILVGIMGTILYLGSNKILNSVSVLAQSTPNGYVIQAGPTESQPYVQHELSTAEVMLTNIADHGSSGPAGQAGGEQLLATPSANNGAAGSGPAHSKLP